MARQIVVMHIVFPRLGNVNLEYWAGATVGVYYEEGCSCTTLALWQPIVRMEFGGSATILWRNGEAA